MSTETDFKSTELKILVQILGAQSPPVSFIDKRGTTVVLPMDSHTPFARHIVNYDITELKRYSINQVYQNYGFTDIPDSKLEFRPPRSQVDLAFDIVTPSPSRQTDAEVIVNFSKVLRDCGLPVVLQISHHLLLKAILIHCKVRSEQETATCFQLNKKLADKYRNLFGHSYRETSTPQQHQQSPLFEKLLKLLDIVGKIEDVRPCITNLLRGRALELADQALTELQEIITEAKRMGLACPIFLCLNVGLENYDTHSGLLFRFISHSDSQM